MSTAATVASIKNTPRRSSITGALAAHWPEYLGEAAGLALFMVSACAFTVWFEYPGSYLHQAVADPTLRRTLIGIAMGLTLIALIYSPWGKRSGAHLNPSFTLTFLALRKIAPCDALFYISAQFVGGYLGVILTCAVMGSSVAHPAVNYAGTVPGAAGVAAAFAGEFVISLCQMLIVLLVSNSRRLSRYTPFVAAFMLATYISIEAPLSGMSMNPARTLGSAIPSGTYTALWLYFAAPLLGMATAGLVYSRWRGTHRVFCAKFHHHNDKRCIFRCNYGALAANQERD